MKELINIHSGQVADRNVNADKSYKMRLKIIESMKKGEERSGCHYEL